MPDRSTAEWRPSSRIVSSWFPPIGVFDGNTSPEDLDALFPIEAMTNPRLRQETGRIDLVPPSRRCCGPGATSIVVAFTHLNTEASRVPNGS